MAQDIKRSYAKITLVVTALLVGALFASLSYFESLIEKPADKPQPPVTNENPPASKSETPPVLENLTPPSITETQPAPAPPADASTISYKDSRFITVANESYTAVFCDRGAVLSILRFVDKDGKITFARTPLHPMESPNHPLQLLSHQHLKEEFADRKPELYDPASAEFAGYWDDSLPSTFGFAGSEAWRNAVRWETSGPVVHSDHTELTFTSPADSRGVSIAKRFLIYGAHKVVCELEVRNSGAEQASPQLFLYGPVGIAENFKEFRESMLENTNTGIVALYQSGGGLSYSGDHRMFVDAAGAMAEIDEELREQGKAGRTTSVPFHKLFEPDPERELLLAGLTNGYFIAAIGMDYLPEFEGRAGADVVERPDRIARKAALEEFYTCVTFNFPETQIAPGAEPLKRRAALYVGPNSEKYIEPALAAGWPAGHDEKISWTELVPTGWPLVISGPITWLLRWLKDTTNSVGIAIILLTIIVRLCMSPLSVKGQMSMQIHGARMKKIKPKIDEIKEKYKNDKSREAQMLMFQETRAAMKAAGASFFPLGGCLPLLLQFPIFIALYNSLRHSFLLHHESFLWINDLSRPDAIYGAIESTFIGISFHGYVTLNILPLIWGAMMFIMQSRTPKATDPQQRQMQVMMTWIMNPLMILFFYALPAGFVLYFVASIMFSWIESTLVRRYLYAKGLIDDPRGASAMPGTAM